MTAETAQSLIEPDVAQMRQHVEHLFGGYLDGCHDGKIELAWTDARDGKLRHASIFSTDELDALVERAVKENRLPGQNVYIGQALRKPDVPPFGRCTDADFRAMTTLYIDVDDDVLAAARERYQQAGCPPTAVVVTGRQPHTRAQMLWRLELPERDADLCRRQNLALAEALGGDTTVVKQALAATSTTWKWQTKAETAGITVNADELAIAVLQLGATPAASAPRRYMALAG